MRDYTVPIVIVKEPEDPGYYAYCPALPGCVTGGLTVEETRTNMRDAISLVIEDMIACGEALPPEIMESYAELMSVPVAV